MIHTILSDIWLPIGKIQKKTMVCNHNDMKRILPTYCSLRCFLYAYMTVMSITDRFVATVEGLNEILLLHYSPIFTRILGFLSFAMSRRLTESERLRRLILVFFTTLIFVSALVLILFTNEGKWGLPQSIMITAVYTLSFSIGYMGE